MSIGAPVPARVDAATKQALLGLLATRSDRVGLWSRRVVCSGWTCAGPAGGPTVRTRTPTRGWSTPAREGR